MQLFLLLALFSLVNGITGAINSFALGDPKLIAGLLSNGVLTSLIQVIPALIGVSISIKLLNKGNELSVGFLRFSKVYSYLWILFIPVGTILGIKQLRLIGNA